MLKRTFAGAIAAVLMTTGASAQTSNAGADDAASAFDGFKLGASVETRHHEVKGDVAPLTKIDDRSGGVGFRGFAGYDKTIGGVGLIGIEAGVGKGGKDVQQAVSGGSYRMNPGWAWDASVRFGVLPTPNLLLYGRTGYGWTKMKEAIVPVAVTTPITRKRTDGGLMYGVGAEFQVVQGFALRTEFDQTHFGKGVKSARLQLGGVIRF